MNEITKKLNNTKIRAARTRSSIHGTANRPRLSVHISNKQISAQIINDEEQKTLVAASSLGLKAKGTMIEMAQAVGTDIAKKAKSKKIKAVVFDRGSKQYHGRIKALADAARKEGLEF